MDDANPITPTTPGTDGDGPGALGFEAALERLGQAVEALEGGDLGLDAALARYEEGVRLLVRCRALLDGAERKVALLTGIEADGTPVTEPFDAQATADRATPRPAAGPDGADVEGDEDDAPF